MYSKRTSDAKYYRSHRARSNMFIYSSNEVGEIQQCKMRLHSSKPSSFNVNLLLVQWDYWLTKKNMLIRRIFFLLFFIFVGYMISIQLYHLVCMIIDVERNKHHSFVFVGGHPRSGEFIRGQVLTNVNWNLRMGLMRRSMEPFIYLFFAFFTYHFV